MPPPPNESSWPHGLRLLSAAAGIRAFCIGLTGVLLGLHLARLGSTAVQVGLVVGAGLAGNALAAAGLAWFPGRFQPRTVLLVTTVLSAFGLFALDSLGGGFLAGSILSYWFFKRFGLSGEVIGPLFLGARALNAASYFGADFLSRRIGLIRTMVFTHLPSSAFLLFLPWTRTQVLAGSLFLAREALVQMDVPARQAFVAAVTRPGERVYAFGVTGLVRNVGWAVGPGLAGWSAELLGLGAPLVLGAGLKMVYDLLLYRSFLKEPRVATPARPD